MSYTIAIGVFVGLIIVGGWLFGIDP